ncbi:MAG: NAD-dependent epimerase/dehydratase family protein [Bacteroidetes bacterium]|nr:NAD-dependent epimerase/dehydratase family protein [Bacteroidota bacterium]
MNPVEKIKTELYEYDIKIRNIFITGGTGYIGRNLIPLFVKRNYYLKLLTRNRYGKKIPDYCDIIEGNALNSISYKDKIRPCETFIHLVGESHPAPWKGKQFSSVDLVSIEEAVKAAVHAGIQNFIYLSVAHPAPVMKEFIKVRMKGEELLRNSGIRCSFIRPWYVTGPGHYWPLVFQPAYKVMENISSTAEFAGRLGLVNIDQLINCIVHAVENPPYNIDIYNVKDIRKF